MLDLGCNRGWCAQLAARGGAQVVGFDLDEPSVTKLFSDAVRERLNILPLVGDFRGLCPAMAGPGIAPPERMRCDMVLALALVHNLLYSLDWPFDTILRNIAALTGKWLVIEFVGAEDVHMKGWIQDHWYFSRYTLDNFLSPLKKEFHKE